MNIKKIIFFLSLVLVVFCFTSCEKKVKISVNSETFSSLGDQYFNNGDYERAISSYIESIRLDNKNVHAYFRLGYIYSTLSEYVLADSYYSKMVEIMPEYAYIIRATEYGRKHEYNNAINEISEAIKNKIRVNDNYLLRANYYYSKGDYEKALSDVEFYMKKNPNTVEAYLSRAAINFMSGKVDKTMDDVNKALRLNKEYLVARFYRGIIYSIRGNNGDAQAEYNIILNKEPVFVSDYFIRGTTYLQLGDNARAISEFNAALERNPKCVEILVSRGDCYSKNSEYNLAINDYNNVINIIPNYTQAYISLGNAYYNMKNYEKARVEYTKAIELQPDNFSGYMARIMTYWQLEHFTEFMTGINASLQKNKNDEIAIIKLLDYMDKLQKNKIINDLNEAIRCAPNFASFYILRGFIFLFNGNYDNAISDYNMAFKLEPNNNDIKNAREAIVETANSLKKSQSDAAKSQNKGISSKDIEALKTLNSLRGLISILSLISTFF